MAYPHKRYSIKLKGKPPQAESKDTVERSPLTHSSFPPPTRKVSRGLVISIFLPRKTEKLHLIFTHTQTNEIRKAIIGANDAIASVRAKPKMA
nr:hypothetical protein [Zea mays]